jgi:hypothetical protein
MEEIEICTYCETDPVTNSEHVFPDGLGGDDIFMDCVCKKCNSVFSKFESDLMKHSIVGFMRTAEGLTSKKKKGKSNLHFQELFLNDKKNKVIYEVGVGAGLKTFMRTQVIRVNNNFYIEGDSDDELKYFSELYSEWAKENLTIIYEFAKNKNQRYKGIKLVWNLDHYDFEEVEIEKITNEIINIPFKRKGKEFRHFEPRMFISEDKQILIRSRNIEETKFFIIDLLKSTRAKVPLFTYPNKDMTNVVTVGHSFNIVKFQRAIVKVGLNCLIHCYPDTKNNPLLRPIKDFSLGKIDKINGEFGNTKIYTDKIEDSHSILFNQQSDGLKIRVSLFSGAVSYQYLINNLIQFQLNHISLFEVKFKERKQAHYSMMETMRIIMNHQ